MGSSCRMKSSSQATSAATDEGTVHAHGLCRSGANTRLFERKVCWRRKERCRQEDGRSQVDGRLNGWRECPLQKEVVEGQVGDSNRQETRPQASEKATCCNGEKETRRRGIYEPSHCQRDTAGNRGQTVTLNCGEGLHLFCSSHLTYQSLLTLPRSLSL